MKKIFVAEQFTPTKFNTAQDKADFANWLIDFMESGFKATKFYKLQYVQLSNCFGHIAHYNKAGFYDHWFETVNKQLMFRANIRQWPCYGDPAFTFSDVEKAIKKHLASK
jgi:hypothetical protein